MAIRTRQGPVQRGQAGVAKKDLWDKISTLTIPFVSLVVGLLGSYATFTYNRSDLRQKKAQADSALALQQEQEKNARLTAQTQSLEHLFTYVASGDPQKREFGYSMFAAMGQGELAARLINLKHDKAGIQVLKTLAQDKNSAVSSVAKEGLASLENAQSAGDIVLRSRSSCRVFAEGGFRVAKRIPATDSDYLAAAEKLGVEPAALQALIKVAAGPSQLPDGRPSILFEPQVFQRLTFGAYDTKYPNLSSLQPTFGANRAQQYDRLTLAAKLNCPAALAATDWGAFSITGRQYKQAGYDYVDDFVKDVIGSGVKELDAAVTMFRSLRIVDPLKAKDWAEVARRYNGAGYKATRYDERLATAYQKYVDGSRSETPAKP